MATDPWAEFRSTPSAPSAAPISVPQDVFIPAPGAEAETEAKRRGEARDIERLGISQAGEAREARGELSKEEKALRDAFEGQKPVTDYLTALPAFSGILDLATGTPNKAKDFTIITLFNKVQDPGSAVLGGEREAAQDVGTLFEKYKTQLQGIFDPEAGFVSPEARKQFVQATHALIVERRRAYDAMRNRYSKIAENSRIPIDPNQVVGPHYGNEFNAPIKENWAKIFPEAEKPVTGGEGPVVSVSPEKSIEAFGEFTGGQPAYDAQGNIVGFDYGMTGKPIYDAQGNLITADYGLFGKVSEEALQQPAPSFYEGVIKSVTGEGQATPTTERLPDWVNMPELQQIFSLPSMQVAASTLLGGSPQEIAQIVQSNFPDVKVFQDERGNYIMQSPSTGQQYAIKPGLQVSDIPRIAGTLATGAIGRGAGALRTGLQEAALQTGIETLQSGAGGTFNLSDIALAGAGGAALQRGAELLPEAVQAVRNVRRGGMPPAGGAPMPPAGPVAPSGGAMGGAAPETVLPPMGVPMGAETTSALPPTPRMFEAGETVTSRAGGAMGTSPETLRVTQAEGLPVPVELTRGAATRDPEQLAFEKEQLYGSLGGPLRKRAEENNLQALQNFDRFIDMTGAEAPDISATGNAVIKALSQGYEASKNRVRAAYRRADKAGETGELISYASLVDYINQQTPTTRTSLAPILQSTLEKLRMEDPQGTGMISIRALEDVRKSVNKAIQPGTPNATYGSAIKDMIDTATEGVGGDLYKEARRLRIEQANKFENRGIVARLVSNIKNMDDRRVPADRVFQNVILNESPENIRFLRSTLRDLGDDGKQAWSELQAATLRHIQERATSNVNLTAENLPVISAAQLNKAVSELDKNGRLDLIFNPKMAQQVRDLRDVVQYVNTVPPGTSINNSGTARTLAAMMMEMGATFTGTGIPVPLITGVKLIRDQIKDAKIKKQINRSLLPRSERD